MDDRKITKSSNSNKIIQTNISAISLFHFFLQDVPASNYADENTAFCTSFKTRRTVKVNFPSRVQVCLNLIFASNNSTLL